MREESVLVLYGSQRGTSEKAARKFAKELPDEISNVTIIPDFMELDEFLEKEGTPITRYIVIFVSSFGNGQAPFGARQFRKLCDSWADKSFAGRPKLLDGVSFSILGFGGTCSRIAVYFYMHSLLTLPF